ncbi:hypothetical protein Tcan_00544, partial [Toxocara canis]
MATRTVCIKAFARFSLQITSDTTEQRDVTLRIHSQVLNEKMVNDNPLKQTGKGRFRTMTLTRYSYGWLGSRCPPTSSYVPEVGEVANMVHERIVSTLTRTEDCKPEKGKCVHDNGILMWNLEDWRRMCPYKKVDRSRSALTATTLLQTIYSRLSCWKVSMTNRKLQIKRIGVVWKMID